METQERSKDSDVGDDKTGSRDFETLADYVEPEKGHQEDAVESSDEESEKSNTLKPALALFWAMRKLKAGANKETIAGVLSKRFEHLQDPNFDKKVDMVLANGVEFGMLSQCGDKYCLNKDYNREMSLRDREERRLRSARSRSPCSSESSQSSGEKTDGVQVVEWALNKLNKQRGFSLNSIKRIVGLKYKQTGNFDMEIAEALQDAVAAKKVVKDGNRYLLNN